MPRGKAIVLSAHFDIAKPVPFIKLSDGKLTGLIDNFAGVFVAYEAARRTGVPLFLTNFEETGFKGASEVAKKLPINTLVIVVDTTRDAKDKDGYIGNVYHLTLPKLPKNLSKRLFVMPGLFEKTQDETWVYGHEFGLPSFYFGVPIPHKKGYHNTNNSITQVAIDKATKTLTDVISWLQTTRS